MAGETAAVAPSRGSSVYFALGSPREDGEMRDAHAWVKAIVASSHHESVQHGSMVSAVALLNRLLQIHLHKPPLELEPDGKNAASHNLPGHTLVLVMNRLPDGGVHGAGLLGYGHHGRLASDLTISMTSLAPMTVDNTTATVAAGPTTAGGPARTDADPAVHLAALLTIVGRTTENLYLVGVGPGATLDPLAARLKQLLPRQRIFFNRGRVRFLRPTTKAQVVDDSGNEVRGIPFDGVGSVELTTPVDSFFRGSEVVL
jgi:hypothetical protein